MNAMPIRLLFAAVAACLFVALVAGAARALM